MIPELHVDLRQPASNRWHLPPFLQEQAKRLLQVYLADLGDVHSFGSMLTEYAEAFIPPVYLKEIEVLAELASCSMENALMANLYYDALKIVLGCTGFAVDTPDGPLHARNLDWWTENAILATFTVITHFTGGPNGHTFKTVGWPGFVGALSGVAPNRFAITLNAVLSTDPPALAKPVSLFLRTVFENARTYTEAIDMLMAEEIASDCLLLVSGTRPGEMVVIERTPTRSAIRYPENGFVAVANEYLALDSLESKTTGQLEVTSWGRFQRATELLNKRLPTTPDDCFVILQDAAVQMNITVQQMVFSASTGQVRVQLP